MLACYKLLENRMVNGVCSFFKLPEIQNKYRVTEIALHIIYKSHIQVYYTLMFSDGKGKTYFMAIGRSFLAAKGNKFCISLISISLQNFAVKKVSLILPVFGVTYLNNDDFLWEMAGNFTAKHC